MKWKRKKMNMLYPHSWDAAWSSLRERRRETWGLIISQHKICMNPEFPNFWNKKTKWRLWMEYVGRWKVSRHIHITKIFSLDQCTIGLSPFNNCTREICPFAPIFQRSNCFRVKYLEITFTFYIYLGISWIEATEAMESMGLLTSWWRDVFQIFGTS